MPSFTVNNADNQPLVQLEVSLMSHVTVGSNGAVNVTLRMGSVYHRTTTPPPPPRSTTTHVQQEGPGSRRRRRMNPTPAAADRYQMEKLEEKEEQREPKSCSICLDEIDCKKGECVRIVCGHVYHKPCILAWLDNSNSCPMCRTRLPLREGSN